MASLLVAPYFTGFDSNGDPLNGGFVYAYAAGTDTPKDTYTTAAANITNSNPVELDSAGRAVIFIDGSYKFKVTDSLGNVIRTVDNVTAGSLTADGNYGDITVSGAGTVWTINADSVENSMLAEMAANTVKANVSGSTGNPSDVALATNQVIGRLSSNIVAISIGTAADNLVKLDGSAKLPAVDGSQLTGVTSSPQATTTATTSGTTVVLTVDFTTNFSYRLYLNGVSNGSGGNPLTIEASSNAGGAYQTTSYESKNIANTTVTDNTNGFYISAAANGAANGTIDVWQDSTSGATRFAVNVNDNNGNIVSMGGGTMATTAATDRLRFAWSGGASFDAGSISQVVTARR